jgi:hypothetical protein
MGIFKLFRKKPSRDGFISGWLACHKEISVSMFHKFKKFSLYRDELDMLLALKEIEYLVFWLLRRKINESALIDLYKEFLNESEMSYDSFREQLELRYKIYDDAYDKFVSETNRENSSKRGLAIGEILVKIIGNLDLLKNGILKDQNSDDIVMVFLAFEIWFELGIKVVDDMIETAKRKFQIDSFLRDT